MGCEASELLRCIIFEAERATRGETLFKGILVNYDFYERMRYESALNDGGYSGEFNPTNNTFRGLKILRSREVESPFVLI